MSCQAIYLREKCQTTTTTQLPPDPYLYNSKQNPPKTQAITQKSRFALALNRASFSFTPPHLCFGSWRCLAPPAPDWNHEIL